MIRKEALIGSGATIEILKRFAMTCEEIEKIVRAGGQADIEGLLQEFPEEYRDEFRREFQGVVAELHSPVTAPDLADLSEESDTVYGAHSQYTTIEPLARGGMGRVLIAWDKDFTRRVALKEIHPDRADDQRYYQRFLQESMITARLEHPGIPPIYCRGKNSEDQPFYTMRLVTGQDSKSLTQAIEELHRELPGSKTYHSTLRLLLRRLIDVCNTIAYAHNQGVCHRDLKPSNILIGPFGETLVMDWGLAKLFQGEESIGIADLSQPQSPEKTSSDGRSDVVGTRGFVAPECLVGELVTEWPQVDVYALGAMLYSMLCDRTSAYPWDPSQSEQSMCTENSWKHAFKPKWIFERGVPKALQAICLKAIADETSARYRSATQMADDLERFLAGQPVSVFAEGWIDRTVRWVNHNRRLAVSTLLFSTCLSGCLVALAIQQASYYSSLKLKSIQLADALDKESAARLQSEAQEALARKQESLALGTLRSYTDAIVRNESLKSSESMRALRRDLLEIPLLHYEKIKADKSVGAKPSWDYLSELASITEDLAKLSFEYGDAVQCARWTDQSIECYSQLVSIAEENTTKQTKLAEVWMHRLVSSHLSLAGSYRLRGALHLPLDKDSAKEYLDKSANLIDAVPDDSRWRESLLDQRATLNAIRAILAAELKDLQSMSIGFLAAVKDREELLNIARSDISRSDEDQEGLVQQRAVQLDRIQQDQAHVGLLLRCGETQEYFKQFDKHIQLLGERIQRGQNEFESRLSLAWALHNLGLHQRSYGYEKESLGTLEKAVEARRVLIQLYPTVTRYRLDFAISLGELATSLARLNQMEQSIAIRKEGIDELRKLMRDFPDVWEYRVQLVENTHALGSAFEMEFMDRQSQTAFAESLQNCEEVLKAFPGYPAMSLVRPELIRRRSDTFMLEGEWTKAAESLSQEWDALNAVKRHDPMAHCIPNKSLKERLLLWKACCELSDQLEQANQVESYIESLADEPVDRSNQQVTQEDLPEVVRIKEIVRHAEESMRMAQKALLQDAQEEAVKHQQSALGQLQKLTDLAEELRRCKSQGPESPKDWRDQLTAIRRHAIRNPWFALVRSDSDADRWPAEDQKAWKQLWSALESLKP